MMTASWSLTPETISVLSMSSVLLVKKRSRMLLPRVGSETICLSPRFCDISRNRLLTDKEYW